MKRESNLLACVLVAFCSAGSVGSATTIEEFDKKTSTEREEITDSAIKKIGDAYLLENPDQRKADCIKRLFTAANPDASSMGEELVSDAVAKLRSDPTKYHVEGIIFGVISRECP